MANNFPPEEDTELWIKGRPPSIVVVVNALPKFAARREQSSGQVLQELVAKGSRKFRREAEPLVS